MKQSTCTTTTSDVVALAASSVTTKADLVKLQRIVAAFTVAVGLIVLLAPSGLNENVDGLTTFMELTCVATLVWFYAAIHVALRDVSSAGRAPSV